MRGFVSALLFVVALWPRPTATPEPPPYEYQAVEHARLVSVEPLDVQFTSDMAVARARINNPTNLTITVRVELRSGDVTGDAVRVELQPGEPRLLTLDISGVERWRVDWVATVEGVE